MRVALALSRGQSEGTYYEASHIMAGVLGGLASYLWPGDVPDRMRFVETWIRFAGADRPDAIRISVPLLGEALARDQREQESRLLKGTRPQMFGPGYGARVVTGDEVDAGEEEVARVCPSVDAVFRRRQSYPTLFYKHVRCELAHEYQLGGNATAEPMTTRANPGVSYSNMMVHHELPGGEARYRDRREIHFPIEWLVEVTRTIAANVDARAPDGNLPLPARWWQAGG